MRRFIPVIFLSLILGGCASVERVNYELSATRDDVGQITTYDAVNDGLGDYDGATNTCSQCKIFIVGQYIYNSNFNLMLRKVAPDQGEPVYCIMIQYYGSDWIYIPSGETLDIRADGQLMQFSGDGSADKRTRDPDGGVEEQADYIVSLNQIQVLAKAKTVLVKITGQNTFFEKCLNPDNQKFIQSFLTDVSGPGTPLSLQKQDK